MDSRIPPAGANSVALNPAARRPALRPAQLPSALKRPADQVAFSEAALRAAKQAQVSDVRQDLVDRVRQELEQGTYDLDGKLDQALDGLMDDLKEEK